jgi:uroporphyrinogen decarboxylase
MPSQLGSSRLPSRTEKRAAKRAAKAPASAADTLLLRAIRHEPVERVPVWLMRQAGRCDPAYQSYRARVGLDLHALFRSPEHAVAISLLPRRFGTDAIIMYQDILTPLEPMGADFVFAPGPVLAEPVRDGAGVARLKLADPAATLAFIGEEIRALKTELDGDLPLIGFAGAPFTLAAFLIEGASPGAMARTLAFAAEQPGPFGELMDRLTQMTVDYLRYQAACGVDVAQLFESVGDGIPRPLYERFVQPSHERIFGALPAELPGILFVKGSPFPELMLRSGASVLSVGADTSLKALLAEGDGAIAVQGNVDNRLLATGTPEQVAAAVQACIAGSGGRGHILNLNHGLLPETPFANVLAFIQAARTVRLRPQASDAPDLSDE